MDAMATDTSEDFAVFLDAIEAGARARCRAHCVDDTGETWWRHQPTHRDEHRRVAREQLIAALRAGATPVLEATG